MHCWFRKPPQEIQSSIIDHSEPWTSESGSENRHIIYTPLRARQTRIIHLLPDSPGRPLRCNIMLAEFVDMDGVGIAETGVIVQYEALSYSWGDSYCLQWSCVSDRTESSGCPILSSFTQGSSLSMV